MYHWSIELPLENLDLIHSFFLCVMKYLVVFAVACSFCSFPIIPSIRCLVPRLPEWTDLCQDYQEDG